jgi:hypothetical protein
MLEMQVGGRSHLLPPALRPGRAELVIAYVRDQPSWTKPDGFVKWQKAGNSTWMVPVIEPTAMSFRPGREAAGGPGRLSKIVPAIAASSPAGLTLFPSH